MKAILDEMLAALSRGERVVLCSILASSGSVPRGAGAKMAVFEDGRVLGTIGGGAVERLSIQRAQDALKNGGSNELKSYNLHPSEVASTGMICGGAVTVYFQFFAPEQTADVAVLKRWREMLDRDVDLWLLLSLDGDGVNEFHVVTREEIPQDKADYFSTKAVWKNGIYVEPLCHAGSVYIFGGGHVGRALVPVLATVGLPRGDVRQPRGACEERKLSHGERGHLRQLFRYFRQGGAHGGRLCRRDDAGPSGRL